MADKKTTPLSNDQVKELIGLEEELKELQQKHGIEEKGSLWERLISRYYTFKDAHTHKNPVNRKKYCKLCLLGIFGVHHFYAGHWVKGIFYCILSWTGISIAMSLIDAMIAIPMEPDENGMILI